jgi:hypothetical protein
MKATVFVVATFHRWGDELHAFGSRPQAEACVLEYAEEFWDEERFGAFPEDYDRLCTAWNVNGLWGSVESRWELEQFEIELPSTRIIGVSAAAGSTGRD